MKRSFAGAGGLRLAGFHAREKQLMDGRHRGVPRRAVRFGRLPEAHRVELARHDHRATGGERGERRRDEAMHVKERHHAERHVVLRQRVAAGDIARRDREVPVAERHALRPPGAAAGVKDQCHVIDRRRRDRLALRDALDGDPAVRVGIDDQHANALCLRRGAGIGQALGRKQDHLRVGVVEIELELFVLVSRVERRRGRGHRRGQERDDAGEAVRHRHADPIASLDAGGSQRFGERGDVLSQRGVTDLQVLFGNDDRGVCRRHRIGQPEQGRR